MSISPTKRELHSQQMREKIVDTASELFYTYGFDAVSMRDIAGKVGVTTGSLYHHFKNKGDLVMAVFDRHDESLEALTEQFDSSEDPLADIESFLCDVMGERVREDGMDFTRERVLKVMHMDREGALDRAVERLVDRGFEKGCFRPDCTRADVLDSILGMYRGATYEYCVSVEPLDLNALVRRRLRLLFRGLAARE